MEEVMDGTEDELRLVSEPGGDILSWFSIAV